MRAHNILVAYGIVTVTVLWLALSTAGLDQRLVLELHGVFPTWFPLADLIVAPILAAMSAGSLQVPPILRLFLLLLFFCSLSAMFLAFKPYPAAWGLVTLILYIEVFFVIPRWNRWDDRKRSREIDSTPSETGTMAQFGAPTNRGEKTGLRDLALYIVAGLAIVAFLVYHILR